MSAQGRAAAPIAGSVDDLIARSLAGQQPESAARADRGPPALALTGPIERIAVFRALMLGDLLCAVPALRSLRQAFPAARISLIGLPWAQALVERLSCVDDFMAFPGWTGLPERACDFAAVPEFFAGAQAQRFDLAIQLHGSGPIVNALVAGLGARQSAGFRSDGAWWPPEETARYAPWPEHGHETERLLTLIDQLGLARCGSQLEFPLNEDDRRALRGIWTEWQLARPYACIHAGAQLASRRWPLARFAAVADALAEQGMTVVLTGSAQEAALTDALATRMRRPAVNLGGHTSLWTLGALIDGAEFIVCNDTGVSHIATALRCPSVVVSCGADVARWGPPERQRHRVLWQPLACRPCSHAVCPFDHGCATAIEVADVLAAVAPLIPRRRQSMSAGHG